MEFHLSSNTPLSAVKIEGLYYKYPKITDWALRDINLEIPKGTLLMLVGKSGCGKSTLLKIIRGLDREYGGELLGNIIINGIKSNNIDPALLGSSIAIIFQNPAYQLHQPRVINEIMSAPMYQGLPWDECLERARQSAEMIVEDKYLLRDPSKLSSGEQQKVVLAASLAMKADILLLDEPFSYLDSTAASEFLDIVKWLRNNGKTIIISTHDIEPIIEYSDFIAVMNDGCLLTMGKPQDILYSNFLEEFVGTPNFIKVGSRLKKKNVLSYSIRGWSQILGALEMKDFLKTTVHLPDDRSKKKYTQPIIQVENAQFRYPDGKEILSNISFNVYEGEILGIIGRNGSGKSTIAKILTGLLQLQKGSYKVFGKIVNKSPKGFSAMLGYVSQYPGDMFFETSVLAECSFGPTLLGIENPADVAKSTLSQMGLLKYSDRDPRSLSAGEQRLLSIADVLASDPRVVILDEPEFGLDPNSRKKIVALLHKLKEKGKTIIIITQNLEMATFLCSRIVLLKDNKILKSGYVEDVLRSKELLLKAGLKYPDFLEVYTLVTKRIGFIRRENEFISGLVDLLDEKEI